MQVTCLQFLYFGSVGPAFLMLFLAGSFFFPLFGSTMSLIQFFSFSFLKVLYLLLLPILWTFLDNKVAGIPTIKFKILGLFCQLKLKKFMIAIKFHFLCLFCNYMITIILSTEKYKLFYSEHVIECVPAFW